VSDAPPLLEPDERSAPFFEAAARGKLVLQRCEACATWHFPPRRRCPRCGGVALALAEASGRGVVHSHGRAHRAAHPALRERLPLELVAVDLEEGVRMLARLAAGSPPVRAGTPVRVEFEPVAEGVALPVFRPCAGGASLRNSAPQPVE
jgi:uncharacterized OB-fold protein